MQYLQARLAAVPAVGINFAFRGFWAAQQPQIYMNTLLIMHAVNIGLSLARPRAHAGCARDGSGGAGIGTSFSVCKLDQRFTSGWVSNAPHGLRQLLPSANDFSSAQAGGARRARTCCSHRHGGDVLDRRSARHRGGGCGERAHQPDAHARAAVHGGWTRGWRAQRRGAWAGDVDDATQWPWDVAKLAAAPCSASASSRFSYPRCS